MRMYRCDRCGELVASSYKSFIRKPYRGVYRFGKKRRIFARLRQGFAQMDEWLRFYRCGRKLRKVVADIEEAYIKIIPK